MKPLAERLRPKKINQILGQEHLIGNNGILKNFIKNNYLPSLILWGPPGVGKTTLSKTLANEISANLYQINAVSSGVKEIRNIIEECNKNNSSLFYKHNVLFIDEIHRFSKSQQDSLLNAVEKGIFILIGATTENPSFEINAPLVSRCQVLTLYPLEDKYLNKIIENSIKNDVYLKNYNIIVEQTNKLINYSGGDVRKLLNYIELIVNNQISEKEIIINDKTVKKILKDKTLVYDKKGESHYNIISAFIKSIRGSDPDAAAIWLVKMLQSGEDPKFIARRLIILASEDIGLANPKMIAIANSCFEAVEKIGFPECYYPLMQTTIMLAISPKSNSVYVTIKNAKKYLLENKNTNVPIHLRNAPTKLMKKLGYGKEYKYSHNFENNFVKQNYFPENCKPQKIYFPQDNQIEKELNSMFCDFTKQQSD